MKREEVALDEPGAAAPCAAHRVRRTASYAGQGADAFFMWYHEPDGADASDRVAVICPPLGSEYTRSHRSLRHLADRLARAGIPALRFDYPGIGDSPGGDLDPERLEAWRRAIPRAIAHARALSGRETVCVIGVRMGATLAALASAASDIDRLVLWNPCVTGRAYARELRALSLVAERSGGDIGGALESAGFVTSAQTLAALGAIDLRRADIRVRDRVLVLGRDDASPDRSLDARFASLGIAHDCARAPGWGGMMAEHQFTIVPDEALRMIVDWVGDGPPFPLDGETGDRPLFPGREAAPAPSGNRGLSPTITFPFQTLEGRTAMIEETLCRFGADGHLFGILSRDSPATGRPAIVVFNAGAAHHVGPNRLYVELTRNLAAMGLPCLRFDLESIGDSVNRVAARENYPYPRTATADGKAAIDFLRSRYGYTRFIALGLCSGAHAVFHLGLELADDPIEELVMINPMQFYWVEGMSLDTSRRFEDMVQYRKSMRDPLRWLKLARGDVDFRRMAEVLASQATTHARAWFDAACEALLPHGGPRLSKDLKKLFAMRRRLALFVSEGDPGRDVLVAGARLTATRALRDGRIRLQTIPGADHTFSQCRARRDLVGRLVRHLRDAAPSYNRNGIV